MTHKSQVSQMADAILNGASVEESLAVVGVTAVDYDNVMAAQQAFATSAIAKIREYIAVNNAVAVMAGRSQ